MVIQTLREHRYRDGFIIPKGKILDVISQGKEILTVELDGEQKMVRKSQVVILKKKEAKGKKGARASK